MAQFDPPEAMLAELARRWRLELGASLVHDGVIAWIAPARRDGSRYVLKLTEAADESRDEAAGLQVWDGDGVVRLVETCRLDEDVAALLLEECVPGTPLSTVPDHEQDVVLAGLLRRLRVAPPPGTAFRALAGMCGWWADAAEAKGVPDELRYGLDLFRSLPLDLGPQVLLATDLHAGNVLAAQREPWLVIDPKPYVGDPTYDALQHLLNNPPRLLADPLRWVARMADLLDLDAERLRAWLFARCVQQSPEDPYLLEVARLVAP